MSAQQANVLRVAFCLEFSIDCAWSIAVVHIIKNLLDYR